MTCTAGLKLIAEKIFQTTAELSEHIDEFLFSLGLTTVVLLKLPEVENNQFLKQTGVLVLQASRAYGLVFQLCVEELLSTFEQDDIITEVHTTWHVCRMQDVEARREYCSRCTYNHMLYVYTVYTTVNIH